MTTISVTAGDPLQEAANGLKSGDELVFRAGTHYGRIWVPVPEVIVRGEPGAIIDGTLPLDSDDWEEATDNDDYCSLAGKGVWRVRQSQPVWILTNGGDDQVFRIDSSFINTKETAGYYNLTAYEALAMPEGGKAYYDADWWTGLEAAFCYNRSNGYLYLRYRDGRCPPDGMRWSGGVTSHRDPPTDLGTIIMLWEHDDIEILNLHLRGAVDLIAPYRVSNITIDSCKFRAFDYGVRVFSASENIKVLHSDFDSGLIGTTLVPPVAKISGEVPYPPARLQSYHQYMTFKFWHDKSDSTHGAGLSCQGDDQGYPNNVEFAWNYARCCNFGADAGGNRNYFHHNTIENMMDMPFQRSASQAGRNITINDNVVNEAGYGLIRWHEAQHEAGQNYFFNNRIGAQAQVSDFVFLAGPIWEEKGQPSQLVSYWYHNSFSGGHLIFQINDMSEMPGFVAVNNVMSHDGRTSIGYLWPNPVGGFDCNSMSGPLDATKGEWYGPNNQTDLVQIWDTTKCEKEFVMTAELPLGVDVTQPFTIAGRTFGPLPGFEPGYTPQRGWIDRGEENGGDMATLTAQPDSVAPGADVELTWTGGTSVKDWVRLCKVGQSCTDEYWAYTSSCTQSAGSTVKASGTCVFTMPTGSGNYQFEFLADNSYTVIATSNTVTVQEAEPEPEPDEERILAWIIPIRDPEIISLVRKKQKS